MLVGALEGMSSVSQASCFILFQERNQWNGMFIIECFTMFVQVSLCCSLTSWNKIGINSWQFGMNL